MAHRYTLHLTFAADNDVTALALAETMAAKAAEAHPWRLATEPHVTDANDYAERVSTRCYYASDDPDVSCDGPLGSIGIGKRICRMHAAVIYPQYSFVTTNAPPPDDDAEEWRCDSCGRTADEVEVDPDGIHGMCVACSPTPQTYPHAKDTGEDPQ